MKLSKASRPSPAVVIAALALVFAMVGTAVAGPDAISSKITKSKVKTISTKQANKAIDVAEPDLNVKSAKTADNATTADSADRAANVLFAVVDNPPGDGNATVVRSSPANVTVTDGLYVQVNFGQDVSNCAWTATKGNYVQGVNTTATAGFAQTHGGNATSEVSVATRNDAGSLVDDDFHLVVVC